jgi:circadian clock protein KaiB
VSAPSARFESRTVILKLYIADGKWQSQYALANLTAVCERYLRGKYALEVVDLTGSPELAKEADILALPTLVRLEPLPIRRIVGDLSERRPLLMLLGLPGTNAERRSECA